MSNEELRGQGYFESPLCPVCKDGGCIDDYDYSPKQLIKYNKHREAREDKGL